MKQLLILSGKGGTGKTTIAGAFIKMAECRAYADCDVDAPNLHLILAPNNQPGKEDFYGLGKAVIDENKCEDCGVCQNVCRFGAIKENMIDPYECEGCGTCVEFCPSDAITLMDYPSGCLMMYQDGKSFFSTAKLTIGSGTSGKLVTAVKKQLLKETLPDQLVIIDGSPGIGCPVIASISGADMVLIVAEPTVSGISDMQRILKVAQISHVNTAVCINKWDINPCLAERIEEFCSCNQVRFLGKIPFDYLVIQALNNGKSIGEYKSSSAGIAIEEVFIKTIHLLYN